MKATIREFKERGVEVSLGNLSGWIPNLFLTDVPLKNPEKKFHRGRRKILNKNILSLISKMCNFDLPEL